MRRWAPMLAGAFGGMAVVGLLTGLGAVLLLPVLLLFPVVLVRTHRGRTVDVAWAGSGAMPPAFEAVGARLPTPHRSNRPRGSVALSLARVEARELATSPWFGVGIGFWLVLLLVLGVVAPGDVDRAWWELVGLSTMMCHPFVGMAVIASHRNRTRSRRDGCDELFDTCPADVDTRTVGHLGTAWVGAVVCVLGVIGFLLMVAAANPRVYGPIDHEALASVLLCAVLGAGGVVLGVTLGRWAPFGLVPLLVVGAIGLLSGSINAIGGESWATDRLLATFVASPGVDAVFFTRPVWARLGWFAALTVLVAALGLVGGTRWRAAAALAAVAAIVAAAVVLSPAPDNAAVRIANRVADPLSSSTCIRIAGGTRVCAFDEYHALAARTAKELAPVAAALPEGRSRGALLVTRLEQPPERLQEEVQERLRGRPVGGPRGALRIRFFASEENFVAARLRFAAHVLGLPTEAGLGGIGTVVAGEARGVVVLWLAVQGMSAGEAADLLDGGPTSDSSPPGPTSRGNVWPGTCHGEVTVLQWSPTDLAAARALTMLPAARVEQALARDWDRIADPATTTDDLLESVGLSALGPPEPIERRAFTC